MGKCNCSECNCKEYKKANRRKTRSVKVYHTTRLLWAGEPVNQYRAYISPKALREAGYYPGEQVIIVKDPSRSRLVITPYSYYYDAKSLPKDFLAVAVNHDNSIRFVERHLHDSNVCPLNDRIRYKIDGREIRIFNCPFI